MTFLPQPGDTIGGKYRVVRAIGEGGMGAVFEAENTLTQKRIAIKWLQPHGSRREDAAARLVREAQASARIRHPNVVDVYDVERAGDSIFLVMELLDGESLRATLRKRTLAMHALIALLLPAMRGVAAAHRQGVVHRDVKPDNIFLAHEDDAVEPVPKVLDFGISKLTPRDGEQLSLTRTGSTLGTPLYMSCEQLAAARDIDGRADIYAFGVILYEALTGYPPFIADSYSELVMKVATQLPVPPRQLCPDIPLALERIVMWAMAKNRDDRIPTMDLLIQGLEPFGNEQGFRDQSMAGHGSIPLPISHFADPSAVTVALPPLDPPIASGLPGIPAPPTAPASSTYPAFGPSSARGRSPVLLIAGALSFMLVGFGWRFWGDAESLRPVKDSTSSDVPAGAQAVVSETDTTHAARPAASAAAPNFEWDSPSIVQALAPEPVLNVERAPEQVVASVTRAHDAGGKSHTAHYRIKRELYAPTLEPPPSVVLTQSVLSPPQPERQAGAAVSESGESKHRVNREPTPDEF